MDYFRFVEDGLGLSINGELERSLRSVTEKEIVAFRENYFSTASKTTHIFLRPHASQRGFYRPLIDENFLKNEPGSIGLFHFDEKLREGVCIGQLADLLYSILIFSDVVYLRDPLFSLLSWFDGSPDHQYPFRRKNLENYLKWLRAIRPLYESNRVEFYSIGPALELRFGSGSTIGRYNYRGTHDSDASEVLVVNSHLDDIDEMNGLSQQLQADFFLNSRYAVKAYEYWATLSDRGVKRSELSLFEQNSRMLRLDFPIYSASREREFIQIITDEEAADSLRNFLRESVQELLNADALSDKALSKEVCAMAEDRIAILERRLSHIPSLRSRNARYKVYKMVNDPIGSFIDGANSREQASRELKAVGFVSHLLRHSEI